MSSLAAGAPLPRVSVVIPCYNLGRYLDEAVGSVLDQTFQDFEVLVVDDGSDEPETMALLEGYRRPRTRVLRTGNRGLPAARNHGIREAAGTYVCALDADDRLEPAWLEKAVRALDADPSLTFVSHWLRTFGDEEADWTPQSCELRALLDLNTVNGAALVRREAVLAVGGFDESMREGCEDWDLWISLVERGFRGAIIPEVLFRYRRRSDSMSRTMQARQLDLYRRLIEKHAESFRRHLPELVLRRERDARDLEGQVHDLEREHEGWLGPEVARLREEAASLDRKLEELERERAQAAERDRLWREVAELGHRCQHLEGARAAEQARLLQLHAELSRAEGQLRELRSSWSWVLTRPVRTLHAWLRRSKGD